MLHRVLSVVFLSAALSALAVSTANAAEQKVGVVRVDAMLNQLGEFKNIQSNLQDMHRASQSKWQEQAKQFDEMRRNLEKNRITMSDTEIQDAATELQRLERDLAAYEAELQKALNGKRAELMGQFEKKLSEVIRKIAQEQGYSFVVREKLNGQKVLFFHTPEFDITDSVIEAMNAAQ
ncbi:MAG: OmpH family outer membrane protein [Pseudomonadota bacterium]